MNPMKQKILSSLTSVALLATGCGQFNRSENDTQAPVTSMNTTNAQHVQLAVTPLAPNPVKERLAEFVQEFVKKSPPGSQLDLFDGATTFQVTRLKIPELKYPTPRARTKALGQPLLEAAKFLRTNETSALAVEPGGNVLGLLRSLPVADPPPVFVIVSSRWHQPKGDAGFSMLPDQRLPTDDHLIVSPAESPYGLAGYTNRLGGAKVIFVALGEPVSDRADEALRLFWAKAIGQAGGTLELYTQDINRALEAALHPETLAAAPPPELALTGELAMKSAADYVTFANHVAVVRIGGDVPVNDRMEQPGPRVVPSLSREPDGRRRASLPQPHPVITTNRTVVAEDLVRTNMVVTTSLIREPRVSFEVVTNQVTNWVFSTRLHTNSMVATNTVYHTNVVVRTNFVLTSALRSGAQP
jgi:hypothetical protein